MDGRTDRDFGRTDRRRGGGRKRTDRQIEKGRREKLNSGASDLG